MNILFLILITFFLSIPSEAREIGETEITTEDGIEVYQDEKYYLLKKNVVIESDNLILKAENVKINFKNNLHDIIELNAKGNVKFNSIEFRINGIGENLRFEVESEKITIKGIDSELQTEDIVMYSDGLIEVNNLNGEFSLKGKNSKLINENILIIGESIDGSFSNNKDGKEITFLNVIDEKISYVKNNGSEMYANNIKFKNETSLIELIDNVTIIRDGEKVTGDYGTLDTKNNSYKIKSNNQTKVKVIIQNNE